MPQIPIALQLYTLRNETARDFAGTLREVAKIGYAGVEFAGTAAEAGGARWYIVEQDTCPGPPIESITTSLRNLRAMGKA